MSDAEAQSESEAVLALVRRLVEEGKTFSIALEDDSVLEAALARAKAVGMLKAASMANCKRWVYVKDKGPVCVEW